MTVATLATQVSQLRCMDCGATKPLYGTTEFLCGCGGLYDVEHDFKKALVEKTTAAMASDPATYWKQQFAARRVRPSNILGDSGVWRFKELVMPSIEHANIISLGEGIIPMQEAGRHLREWVGGGLDLYLLPEGMGPTGSFKDFGMTVMMSVAKQSGIDAVGCASTGDTSAAVAAYAARAGIECVVVLPEGQVTDVQLSQPLAHGARIITVPGSFDDCMRIVRALADMGMLCLANSINPARIEGHQATVFLIAQYFGWELPDYIALPVGNGSNTSSVGKGMRVLEEQGFITKLSGIIATQSDAANPLARSWESVQLNGFADPEEWIEAYKPQPKLGETTATAARIGNPVSWKKVVREITHSRGKVLSATESTLNQAVMVAGRDGLSICPQTGTALAGLRQAVMRGLVEHGSQVVVVSTAHGLKFPNVPTMYGKDLIQSVQSLDPEVVARAL